MLITHLLQKLCMFQYYCWICFYMVCHILTIIVTIWTDLDSLNLFVSHLLLQTFCTK